MPFLNKIKQHFLNETGAVRYKNDRTKSLRFFIPPYIIVLRITMFYKSHFLNNQVCYMQMRFENDNKLWEIGRVKTVQFPHECNRIESVRVIIFENYVLRRIIASGFD